MASYPLSSTARTMLRTKRAVWGVLLLIAGGVLITATDFWVAALLLMLTGLALAATGVIATVKAHRFNRQDAAIAESIRHELGQLLIQPPTSAFTPGDDGWQVSRGSVVELQRHFDQDTVGGLQGTLDHRYSLFASSFGTTLGSGGRDWFGGTSLVSTSGFLTGVSNLNLRLNSVTRDNLMGDALFSVLEFETAAGDFDTMRLISMSQPAASAWIGGLVDTVGQGLGGHTTHAGTAVLHHVQPMVDHFTPRDISYTTDRLMALERRSRNGESPTIRALGQPVGRNAMLATEILFSDGQCTRLFPVRFPDLFGGAIGLATSRAFSELEGKRRAAIE